MRGLSVAGVIALVAALAGGCREHNPAYESAHAPPDGASAKDTAPDRGSPAQPRPEPGREAGVPDVPGPDLRGLETRPPDARAPAVACPADPDLLLCMRFEGSLRDESPSAHVFTGTGIGYTSGPDGLALNHMLTSDVRIPNSTAFDGARVTLEMWIQPRILPTGTMRAAVMDYQRQYSLFVYPDGTVRCAVNDGSPDAAEVRVAGVLQPGVWTSVACTADATMASVWVGGVMRATLPLAAFKPFTNSPGGLFIGTNIPGGAATDPNPFDGLIDNLRIWRRLRTAQELCASAIGCSL